MSETPATTRGIYRRMSIDEAARKLVRADGSPAILRGDTLCGPAQLRVPSLEFGDIGLEHLALAQHPPDAWGATDLDYPPLHEYILRDARVHGPDGIITIGDCVIEETLFHIPLLDRGFAVEGGWLGFPIVPHLGGVARALHVMGGGHENHFHWLLEILPRLQVSPLRAGGEAGVVLLPPISSPAQFGLLEVIAIAGHATLHLVQAGSWDVERLRFVPSLAGLGYRPHPMLSSMFDGLARAMSGIVAGRTGRRIYLSRRDSRNRPLTNEAEVIALTEQHGFETVSLAGRSLAEHAALFASASHIVAPHGAGLANILFCHPGTVLCELQMDQYVFWCFRRLAAIRRIRYGCIIGTAEQERSAGGWVHHLPWTVPLDRLAAVLEGPAFARLCGGG